MHHYRARGHCREYSQHDDVDGRDKPGHDNNGELPHKFRLPYPSTKSLRAKPCA